MTYEQYWEGDPTMTQDYLKAYKLKNERIEWKLWELGVYEYEALCDVSPILHAFSKNGTKPLPFAERPIFLRTQDESISAEEKQRKEKQLAENERLKAEINFKIWAKQIEKKFSKKENNNDNKQ